MVAHETLHLHGMPDLYGIPDGAPSGYDFFDSAGSWDLMSDGDPLADLFGWNKLLLGWIPPSDVECLADAGSVEVDLTAFESPSGTRMAVLPIDGPEDRRMVLEYRAEERQAGNADCETGVIAYTVDPRGANARGAYVVYDQEPGTDTTGPQPCERQKDDAPLNVGDGRLDLGNGFAAEVLSADGSAARVRIERTDTIDVPAWSTDGCLDDHTAARSVNLDESVPFNSGYASEDAGQTVVAADRGGPSVWCVVDLPAGDAVLTVTPGNGFAAGATVYPGDTTDFSDEISRNGGVDPFEVRFTSPGGPTLIMLNGIAGGDQGGEGTFTITSSSTGPPPPPPGGASSPFPPGTSRVDAGNGGTPTAIANRVCQTLLDTPDSAARVILARRLRRRSRRGTPGGR